MNTATPTRPVLRYHGGKWRLAPWVISHFPRHRGYVEPYGGAASILMRKPRAPIEVYNDLNEQVVDIFQILRDPDMSKRLAELLYLTPFARDEFDLSYEASPDRLESARRFVVRSFFGYGSKAMFESKNGFRSRRSQSCPPARDWSTYPAQIKLFYARLQGVVIENRPALEIIERYDREDYLIYLDPPYVHSARNVRTGRYSNEMTDQDHIDLAEAARKIRGMAIISGYQCDLYDELYHDWIRFDRKTFADKARPRVESLWISPKCQIQPGLFEE